MTPFNRFVKRSFDIVCAICALAISGPIIICSAAIMRWDTGKSGFFRHTRIGLNGQCFDVLKIRTMRDVPNCTTSVTTRKDPRITRWGSFFRRSKLDELPQFVNILRGEMSFVGPRPDVPEQWEQVSQVDKRILLSVRPGISGPASLRYREEESLLANQKDPEDFNRTVIFPDKVRINKLYIANYSFWQDCLYLFDTIVGRSFVSGYDDLKSIEEVEAAADLKIVARKNSHETFSGRRAA